eukprot:10509666-Alexandrium_andersonii.AAC.1
MPRPPSSIALAARGRVPNAVCGRACVFARQAGAQCGVGCDCLLHVHAARPRWSWALSLRQLWSARVVVGCT